MTPPARRARPSVIAKLGLTGAPAMAAAVSPTPPPAAPHEPVAGETVPTRTDPLGTAENVSDAATAPQTGERAESRASVPTDVGAPVPAHEPAGEHTDTPTPAHADTREDASADARVDAPTDVGTPERTDSRTSARTDARTRARTGTRTRARTRAREIQPAGVVPPEVQRAVDVEARRYAAALRKLQAREFDLARTVRAALDAGATPQQVTVWLHAVLPELPEAVADEL